MEYKYVQFPLSFMQEVIKDRRKGLNQCLDYGIGHLATAQQTDAKSMMRQIVYDYYKNTDKLPRDLRVAIEEAEAEDLFTRDDDYKGFNTDGGFDPILNIEELAGILRDNPDLNDEAKEYYQWHQAAGFFKGSINIYNAAAVRKSYFKAKAMKESFEADFGKDAMPSVKPGLLFNYLDNPKQDISLLLAYIGICSLIGQRNFISTSKPVILSRMIGAKSKAAFQAFSKNKESKEIIARFSKRWPMDKLLLSLAEQKFIMFLTRPHVSVVYVSKYMEPDELAKLVKQSQDRYNLKDKIKQASQGI